jgi:hypothetical protein
MFEVPSEYTFKRVAPKKGEEQLAELKITFATASHHVMMNFTKGRITSGSLRVFRKGL